jgi:hypothetical protein
VTCLEMNGILSGGGLTAEARQHLAACPRCRALSEALSAAPAYKVDAAVLNRARGQILQSLAPVRPLPPAGAFASLFLSIAGAMAVAAAAFARVRGLTSLSGSQAAVVFGLLLALLLGTSFVVALDMRPGARTVRGMVVFLVAIGAVEAAFLMLFHDYEAGRFLHWGWACFRMGALCAAATGAIAWVILRRGYVVAPASTGASVGALAGLAGLAALELHCPILNVPHLAIWHAGVLAASVAVGAAIGAGIRTASSSVH